MDSTRECAGIRSQLGVYITGAIAPQDRTAVARHLAACEPCREDLASLAGLPGLLRRPPVQDAAEGGPAEWGPADWGSAGSGGGPDWPPEPAGALTGITRHRRRRRWLLAGAAALLVAVAAAGWVPRLTGPAASGREVMAPTVLETQKVGPATVLTDAEGYTLYWYSSDTATESNCTGSCATSWPPVSGPAIAGDGVTGELGAIARADGSLQATYDGHPLYTASKDMLPGQAKGNDVRDSGGVWHEVIVTGQRRTLGEHFANCTYKLVLKCRSERTLRVTWVTVAEVRNCEQCGALFAPRREHARFCGARCRVAWNRQHAAEPPAVGDALDWTITAMQETVDRLLRARGWDQPHAFAVISEAVWWVTMVDATLVRYHPDDYDQALAAQDPAARQVIEETFGGLRFVRNRMGYYLDHADFICPQGVPGGEGAGPLAAWTWRSLPEPALAEMPPRGQEWEMTRYREYQAQLAAKPVGDIFRRVAAFLHQASAGCLSHS